jgi:hypothetical protein
MVAKVLEEAEMPGHLPTSRKSSLISAIDRDGIPAIRWIFVCLNFFEIN